VDQVTIIIPVWNRREMVGRLLDLLQQQTYPIEEVIAVDNGSTDGAGNLAAERGARVVHLGVNRGFSFAVNRGVELCRTELAAVVNTDVEPSPDWLEKLVQAIQEPGVWFATGKLLSAAEPHQIDGTFDVISRAGCAWRVGSGQADGPSFNERRKIRMAPATAVLYRTELFSAVGMFDPGFESYLEDVDLSLRCASRGKWGLYVPDAIALHHGSASRGRWHPETVRLMARNQVLLVAKHYSDNALRRNLWPILAGQGLWGLVALRHGAFFSFVKGKVQGLAAFRSSRRGHCASDSLLQILHEGEQELRTMSDTSTYWRLYFLLTSSEAN
jgi:GT2 family glycosyltransferase